MLLTMSYTEVANGDIFNTLKIRQPDRPHVCVFEANPEITDNWEQLKVATLKGIYEWEAKLKEMYPDGDWKIKIFNIIPWVEHENKYTSDYKYCNIMINFEKKNLKTNAVGTTEINFKNSYHKYMFINVYLEHSPSSNITVADGSSGTFKISLSNITLTPSTVRNVVLHEVGHALGLLHYEINTPFKVNEYGTDRSAMYYAINVNSKQILSVKIPDIQMIKELYGEDGWVGMTPPWNIRSCMVTGDITYNCR